MTDPTASSAQALLSMLSIIETDVLETFGTPLLNFLTAIKANPSPLNEAAQWVALQGALIGALPTFETSIAAQIIGALQAKLAAAIAKAQTPAA